LSNTESSGVTSGNFFFFAQSQKLLLFVDTCSLSEKQRVTLPIVSFASNPLVALLGLAALRDDGWFVEVSCVLCLHFLPNRLISRLVVVLQHSR
jgi:hypothetical protein